MDYRRIYKQLCDRGQIRTKESGVFYERHHIKPKSFGGRKTKDNLTLLTLKEHYIAHLLLAAMYPDSPAMQRALWNMCNATPDNKAGYERYKPSSRIYDRIRTEYTIKCSGVNSPTYGRRMDPELLERLRVLSIGNKYKLGTKHSEDTKDRIRQKKIGIKQSAEALAKNKLANRGGKCYKAKKIVCTATGQEFGSGRELSEFLDIPFSTIRRWLNGNNEPPEDFHYRREEDIGKEVIYKYERVHKYGKKPN